MSLSASEIAAVVEELAPAALGARVDALRVHAERALTLELFGRAGPLTVLLSAEPDVTRVHAVRRRPPQPPAPLPFQALLRRELEGARVTRLSARPGDRVVELELDRPSPAGAPPSAPLRLVAELTGRHGNLFLVGGDGVIRASAGRNLSQRRDLVPGRPYAFPAERPAAGEAAPPALARVAGERFPLSAAIEERYGALEEARLVGEARRRLREPLRAALGRARRALDKLEAEAARVPAADEDRRRADLLKANLHLVRRGARTVRLNEWTAEGAREVELALDPAATPRENMERLYRRYRRIAESAGRVAARQAEVRARVDELLRLAGVVEAASLDELPRLEREARRLGAGPLPPPRPRARRDEPLPPYRLFRSLSGVPLLVGRSAEANDALTARVARGNDLWLHVRAPAGAHVVARLDKGKAPDQDTVLDGAHLAAWFSDARGEPTVEVVATRAKFVRKPKGAAPGAVSYSQERTVRLRVEPQRIERLLAGEQPP